MYSCSVNSNQRWDGQCSKCYRISEYCDTLNIDKSLIGMQENIKIVKERSGVISHYGNILDKLYGSKKSLLKIFKRN